MVEKHYGHLAPSFIADAIRAGAPRYRVKDTNAKWCRCVRFARVREGIEIPGGIGEDIGMCVRRLSVEADPKFHGPNLGTSEVPNERVINAKDEAFMRAAPFAARKTRPGATAAAPLCVCHL